MADLKISQLNSGTAAIADELPIARSGANFKVTAQSIKDVPATKYTLDSAAIITEAGTTKTLASGDNGKVIYCTSNSAVTITTAVDLGAGFSCVVIQGGDGQVTIDQGSSTTRVSYGSLFKTAGKYAAINIISPVADTFIVSGQTA
jgi:hypothetical protein